MNNDDAHNKAAEYEDLRRRCSEFLHAAGQFVVSGRNKPELANANISLVEGVKRIWTKRHQDIATVGLLGVAAAICHLADPMSVAVSGAIVGGKNVVDAIKAARGHRKTKGGG